MLLAGDTMLETTYGKYWQTVIDTMLEGLMLVDPDGKIVFVNRAFERLTGYTKKEVEGRSCEILGCDTCFVTRKDGKDKYCALFKEGQVRRRKCIFQKKDGGELHVLKNAALIKDSSGKVVGGVENLTDLSSIIEKEEVILRLRKELSSEDGFYGMLGKSAAMKKAKAAGVTAAPAAVAVAAAPVDSAPAPVAVGIEPPKLIEISDDMPADEKRKARIANSKAKSAFNKSLKAAGIDPKTFRKLRDQHEPGSDRRRRRHVGRRL